MRKVISIFSVFLSFSFIFTFIYLFYFFGLRDYINVIASIDKLGLDDKKSAQSQFFISDDGVKYSGTLAHVSNNRIWVWTNYKLKSFKVDQYSVYSFYSACSAIQGEDFSTQGKFSVSRSVDSKISDWKKKTKVGNYINLWLTTKEKGGTVGNLREIYGYDWWVFMPTDIKKQCEK